MMALTVANRGMDGHLDTVACPDWPLLICLLGRFRVLVDGKVVPIRPGGKMASLLTSLALHLDGVDRHTLLNLLWPDHDPELARQSLNTLVSSVHNLFAEALSGLPPVLHTDGYYRLNTRAGVGLDTEQFDSYVDVADRHHDFGDLASAEATYERAVACYCGDLGSGKDVRAVMERERLRARYLTSLLRLAQYAFARADDDRCLTHSRALLATEACREDAHRLIMSVYVRRGERVLALRQYRLCETTLASDFGAVPELATRELFDRIRLNPAYI